MKFPIEQKFILSNQFLEKYKNIKPNFGFNGLGEFVFMRTYSRLKPDGKNERWWETVQRVVEGLYSIQKQHIEDYGLGWNQTKAQKSAQEMYDRIFNFKMLPPGRSLWALGTDIVMVKGLTEALYNCSFISTKDISPYDVGLPFGNAMDFLMLGVGVGFDVQGAGKVEVKPQREIKHSYIIPDTREGWVESTIMLINSFFGGANYEFDYSIIRPAGSLIKTFGGISAGAQPLIDLHKGIIKTLEKNTGNSITATTIADIINMIGKAVVSGNVRRSAEIILGEQTEEFLNLKNYERNPERINFGWASNNSIYAELGMNYQEIAERIAINGEPGIFWKLNAQKYGRMRATEANWKDKRVEGLNPCVIGETEILTKKGYEQIQDLVNQEIEIWNGFEWSFVTPKITGKNQETVTISFNDGRSLTCTPYHKFYIADGYSGKSIEKEAKDLRVGDKLIKHTFPVLEFEKTLEHPYTNGFVAAEGMELSRTLYLYKPKEICFDRITNKRSFKHEEKNNRYRIVLDSVPTSKSFVPIEYDLNSKLEWLAGLFDGDGTELKEGGLQLTSVNPVFLRDLQKLLSILGIQCKIVTGNDSGIRFMPDHKGGTKEYFCKKSERICIGATQMQELVSLGLKCERLSFNKNPQRDASQFTSVTDITESEIAEFVYCFNEPKNHTGIFNGIIAGQCGEITLESSELCNLVELFPNNHESVEDFLKTIKYAYLYAKTITLLNTNWAETNKVMLRNRRIGLSMTGITQFLGKHDLNQLKHWMREGYKKATEYDEIYSDWFAIPKSKKLTTIKPSGTISLLAGSTPGVHFPESTYYIRRVRLAHNSPFIKILQESGYNIEAANEDPKNMVVVEFPVSSGENTKTINEVTMWEQLNLASFTQENWADNSVSVTITFKNGESKYIKSALDYYQFKLKSVSFLPKLEKGAYSQMPYEEINKETYEKMLTAITPLNFTNMFSVESIGEQYCNNDVCMI